VESTQLVPDTKTPLQTTAKSNPKTQPKTKDLCGPKMKTHNLENEAMERVINSDKTKNTGSPSIQKTKPNNRKNTTQQKGL